jgi:hypothetical protein
MSDQYNGGLTEAKYIGAVRILNLDMVRVKAAPTCEASR